MFFTLVLCYHSVIIWRQTTYGTRFTFIGSDRLVGDDFLSRFDVISFDKRRRKLIHCHHHDVIVSLFLSIQKKNKESPILVRKKKIWSTSRIIIITKKKKKKTRLIPVVDWVPAGRILHPRYRYRKEVDQRIR